MSIGLVSIWSKAADDFGDMVQSEGKCHCLLLKNLHSDNISCLFTLFFVAFHAYLICANNLDPGN